MPDIVVHNAMGRKVLNKLSPEIMDLINKDVFYFSVLGPDPFIFYRFFLPCLRHGVNARSNTMHQKKTGQFLMELGAYARNPEIFSFLAGFLCHYALDSISHPFIDDMAKNNYKMHIAIEHKLDVLELERQGKQRRDIMKLFPKFPDLPAVRLSLKNIYGWDDNCYEVGYWYMILYHWFAKDQSGLVNMIFHKAKGKRGAISYRNHLCDDMSLEDFASLENNAVDYAVNLISAAYDYREGIISKEEMQIIVGNRSYSGGRAE